MKPSPSAFQPIQSSLAGLLLGLFSILPLHAGTYAQFRTVFGDLEVELFDQDKPVTVRNFLNYLESGLYDGLFIHRLAPGFVVQAGAFVTTNKVDSPILRVPVFGTITNEYSVGRTFSNTYGTLAMARVGGEVNSATSQWFFNLADNAFLDGVDGGFTVFGRVIGGTNVLTALNGFRTGAQTNGIFDVRTTFNDGAFGELPLLSPFLQYQYLLYVDITTLRVQVVPAAGGREIVWNSVSNRVNRVEFTTVMPPQWQTLLNTNGNGALLRVLDPAADPGRFYRVRIATD